LPDRDLERILAELRRKRDELAAVHIGKDADKRAESVPPKEPDETDETPTDG
jgi:hypothetical protein